MYIAYIAYIITNKGLGIIVRSENSTRKAAAVFMIPNPPGVWDCD